MDNLYGKLTNNKKLDKTHNKDSLQQVSEGKNKSQMETMVLFPKFSPLREVCLRWRGVTTRYLASATMAHLILCMSSHNARCHDPLRGALVDGD